MVGRRREVAGRSRHKKQEAEKWEGQKLAWDVFARHVDELCTLRGQGVLGQGRAPLAAESIPEPAL